MPDGHHVLCSGMTSVSSRTSRAFLLVPLGAFFGSSLPISLGSSGQDGGALGIPRATRGYHSVLSFLTALSRAVSLQGSAEPLSIAIYISI